MKDLKSTHTHNEQQEKEVISLMESPVHAGFPSPATDYVERELDFNALLIRNPSTTFCLRVRGESMSGAGINTDDILVVDRSLTPRPNNIVVASIDGDFTLKRFIHERGALILRPENSDFQDIEINGSVELVVFGVVTSVIKQFTY